VDETGFRQGNADGQNPTGKKAWVWVAVSAHLTVFRIALSRGQEAAKALLGEGFKGLVGCDRWSGYFWLPLAQRAYCWAHLAREYQRIAQRSGESTHLGEELLRVVEDVFTARREDRLAAEQDRLRERMRQLLEQGAAYVPAKGEKSERAKTARTCRSLLAVEAAYWTFAGPEQVELTNNAAERAIRPVVVWRKVCYGTQSERGSRLLERVFTVTASCRQQGRSAWQILTQAVEAYLGKGSRPSLIPSNLHEPPSQAVFMQAA
jgi:transposase